MQKSLIPPRAERQPTPVTHHGHTRTDDYAWLRADNWQEVMRNPAALGEDIRAYLDAENAYFAAAMADTEALQETLFKEMRGRIKEDDSSVPSPDGPWAYAVRYVEGGQHPLYVREKRDGGGEQIMLDGNALGEGRAYFRIGGAFHSPDHRLLAWSHDDSGSEFFTLSIRDLDAGGDLADVIPDTGGSAAWSADGHHLFYVRLDANHRPSRVFRHKLGTSPEADVLVYEEPDPGFFVGVGKTQSRRFILIDAHDHQTSEVRMIPADAPEFSRASSHRARRRSSTMSTRRTARSSSSQTPATRRTSRSSPRLPTLPAARAGAISLRTSRAGLSSRMTSRRGISCGLSASRGCRASSCAGSPTTRST